MSREKVYNFSAGPSMMPESVLNKAGSEISDYMGSGMSVMEMSHRSSLFGEIFAETKRKLKETLNVPDSHEILFLQGGASTQFAAVPLNLMNKNRKADYIVSGQFSGKAFKEAQKYGDVRCAGTTKEINFSAVPRLSRSDFRADADYVHMCFNNTIYGTKFPYIPDTGDIPLVADMSSCILSEPVDVTRFGLIYAGAQKNMAPAGLTVVIVREDLIGNARPETPVMLDYQPMAENDSMYNTPPCWPIYIAKLVYEWLLNMGGLKAMKAHNEKKAAVLYDYLDSQSYYIAPVEKESRSMMNVTFVTGDAELDKKFAKEAGAAGLANIKGHRSVGGMRASIYNAMPIEGVQALVAFMRKFAAENPKA